MESGEYRNDQEPTEAEAWIVYADVFGFKQLVHAEGSQSTHVRLADCQRKMAAALELSQGRPRIYTFSDSFFLLYPTPSQDDKNHILRQCLDDVRSVMQIFVLCDLPLKGGMAYGHVSYNRSSLVGDAVARAVEYESLVPAPLMLLPAMEFASETPPFHFDVITPLRGGIDLVNGGWMEGHVVLPSPVDDLASMIAAKILNHGVKGPFRVAKQWVTAHEYLRRVCSQEAGDNRWIKQRS